MMTRMQQKVPAKAPHKVPRMETLDQWWTEQRPRRIIVVGPSGSGKTTLSRKLARLLACPGYDIDDLYWLPGWVSRSDEDLRERLEAVVAGESWALAGNYSRTQDITWPRAELVIWLDFGLPLVFSRVVRRCLWRAFTREPICNGNYESLKMTFMSKNSLLLWVLDSHGRINARYAERLGRPDLPPILRLRSPAAVRRLEEKIWLLERPQKIC